MLLPKNTVGGEHSRADARAHARALSLMELYHSPTASQDAVALWGYYTPTPPHYCFVSFLYTRFVKEQRRKNLQGFACKIFRALDNNEKLK